MTTSIIMGGAAGRMGIAILRCASEDPDFRIAAGLEDPANPSVGGKVGELIGIPAETAPVVGSTSDLPGEGRPVAIHFSSPDATIAGLNWSVDRGLGAVIGTTGLDADQRIQIEAAAAKIPVVFAPNMSVGVNLLFKLTRDVTRILGEAYDIEISETHHRFKKDAPIGTARRLGDIVAEEMGGAYEDLVVDGRSGMIGERPTRQIGMHALRGGDVVGEHTVTFAALGERVELTHRAHSRDTFARGSLRAAAWLAGRDSGLYDMQDVLGLK